MRELRRVTLLAGVLGQLVASVAGVLPWSLLPVAVGLYVAAAVAAERADAQVARVLRGVATGVALILAVIALPGVSGDRDELRAGLGLLLVGIQVLHALTWQARRDLETALGVATALLVLGASYAPDVLVGLPMLLGWAVIVAGAVLSGWQRTQEGVDAVARGGRRPGLARAVALSIVLGIAAFLVLPVDTAGSQRNPLGSVASALGATGAGAVRGNVSYSSGRLDMRVRGTLSDRPIIEVPADSPALWRSQVFPFYDGLTWSADLRRRRVPGPPWVLQPGGGDDRTDQVVRRGRPDGTVWSPGEPVVVDADPGLDLAVDRQGVVSGLGRIGDYSVTSRPPLLDPAALRASVPEPADAVWLQLPAPLPERVRTLATQITSGATTPYDAVLAVEAWLRENATYQLDSPVPVRGEDAVDRFLFVDRTGFCEQFAAAETVLLRAAGIPARMATGLAVGTPAGSSRRLYREKDLHAWVEVLYPGVGWSPSDPTAGVPLAAGAGGTIRQRLVAAVDGALRGAQSLPGGRPVLALLLVAAAAGIVAVSGVRLPRRLSAAPARIGGEPGPALAAFLRYDGRLGERRRRPAESLSELAARLGPEPASALAVVEAECYAPTPPADAERAAAHLDRLEPVGG
ncbi:MAG: hypothetical protein JJD92_10940 [Frankiaceae bacterium]|nr:hypothetical protein [Frankiaceae bacterium]